MKIIYSNKYVLFLLVLILCGCTKDSIEQVFIQQPNSFNLAINGDASFNFDIPTGEKLGINGDKIPILSNGLISLHDVPAVNHYLLYYPDTLLKADNTAKFDLPSEQSYNASTVNISSCPLCTQTDNEGLDSVKLQPVVGALKIVVPANKDFGTVSSVSIESKSDNLSGGLNIDAESGKITSIDNASHKIVLKGAIDVSNDCNLIMALPPQTFTNKLNIKLFSPKGYGQCVIDLTGKTIERGKTLEVTLDNVDWQYATYYYGTANSVIVKPGQTSVTVDCGAYFTSSKNYAYENNQAGDERLALSAHQLWNDVAVDFVKDVTLAADKKSFTVNLNGQSGNAVIAIYDKEDPKAEDAKILWSFHIWVTEYKEQTLTTNVKGNTYTILDRNLGATSATPKDNNSVGFLYQWGRKDPFVGTSSYGTNGTAKMYNEDGELSFSTAAGSENVGTVQYSIEHPRTFIKYSRSNSNISTNPYYYSYDWLYYGDNCLWGNPEGYNYPLASTLEKSIYDPSPAGYMIAPNDTWFGITDGTDKTGTAFADAVWDNGYVVTSNNQQWWYPNCGWRSRKTGGMASADTNGYYWYSSVNSSSSANATLLTMGKDGINLNSNNSRANSSSIRCVKIIK